MNLIKKLSDIDYTATNTVVFNATVLEILYNGDADSKRPFRASLMLEESGEIIQVSSWKFDNLETYKDLVKTLDVYRFEASCGTSAQYGPQVRVGNIEPTGLISKKKVLSGNVDSDNIKNEILNIIQKYIKRDSVYMKLLEKLIINNENYWKWPAATKVHHNYPGGLAFHSLSVCKNALSLISNYNSANVQSDLVVAGALLHDIGKIREYKEDNSRTTYGNFLPHSAGGIISLTKAAIELGIDPEKDTSVILLNHIIASHHEELENGASVKPYVLEALIIARADAIDAAMESAAKALAITNDRSETDKIIGCNGIKLFKF